MITRKKVEKKFRDTKVKVNSLMKSLKECVILLCLLETSETTTGMNDEEYEWFKNTIESILANIENEAKDLRKFIQDTEKELEEHHNN